jgi:glutamate-1-semialdehyde aminotransferase
MLFSKNPDLHLPQLWPAYFSRAKGINIWDLENKNYKDIFLMGVGTNTLGYSYHPIENKIKQNLFKSNMSSLNSIEEILLAEKLIDMHKWAEKVKFTRSGGEANAVAIRIARAYSKRTNIAICGYHGWHDWYLSTNLSNKKNLDNHLIKNLSIKGVPKNLKNTVFPFEYNNYQQLKKLVKDKNIGIIKMEVQRNNVPKNNFLKKIRELCNKKNIILIFDECTSGFRESFGGLHLNYNVNPDILILGKALGNGYAINAVLGNKDIMNASNKTFISSTFWTERMGPIAALETLKQMEKIKSWKLISNIGKNIKKNWLKISKNNGLKIKVQGLDALPNFIFNSKNHNAYKSYISQEMVKKRILASNTVYTCISHGNKDLRNYFDILNNIFKNIKKCEDERETISNLLDVDEGLIGIRGK